MPYKLNTIFISLVIDTKRNYSPNIPRIREKIIVDLVFAIDFKQIELRHWILLQEKNVNHVCFLILFDYSSNIISFISKIIIIYPKNVLSPSI